MTYHGDAEEVSEALLDGDESAPIIQSLKGDSLSGGQPQKNILARVIHLFRCAYNSGIFCCILASLLYSVVGMTTKILSKSIPVLELLMVRSAFIALVCIVAKGCQGSTVTFGLQKGWVLLAANSMASFAGLVSWFSSFTLILVGDAMALSKLSPIFTVFFSFVFRWEAVNLLMAFGALVCCIGGTIILRPPFLFGAQDQWDALWMLGNVLSLTSSVFFSLNYIFVGRIGSNLDEYSINFAGHLLTTCLLFIPVSLSFPSPPVFQATFKDVLIILLFLPSSAVASIILTRGLQLCDGVQGSTLQTCGIVFSYLLGLIFLSEEVTLFAAIGTFVIGFGIWVVAVGKARAETKQIDIPHAQLPT